MNTYNNDSTVSTPRNRSLENLSYAPWKPLEPAHELQAQVFDYYQAIGFSRGEKFWINTYDAGVYRGILGDKVLELWRCKKAEDGWSPAVQISDPIEYLRELGAAGHNIQSYPNHLQGGLSNHHASRFTTVWYEIDDLPLEAQRGKLRWIEETLGLKATITVFSGGKSLHVYFTFDQSIDGETWTRIIRKLAIVAGGDPAICTHARAMRLPGVPRLKNGEAREVAIESLTGTRHDPKEFETALDSTGLFPCGLSYERWLKWRKNRDASVLSIPESEIQPKPVISPVRFEYDGSTIPLEICLSKDDRALLDGGASEGNRDNAGYKLARNLIGTANQLLAMGIRFNGDPRQILEEYGSRCSPQLPARDIERIYRSASCGTPSASLPDEAIQVCVDAYQRRQKSPYSRKAAGFISKEEWLHRHKRPESEREITGWLKSLVRRHQRFSPLLPAGPKTLPPITQPEITGGLLPYGVSLDAAGKRVYRYERGNLPDRDRWQWLGRPRILCADELAQTMVAEGLEKGWKHFHDRSGTGSGKSHLWGDINLGLFKSIDQVFMVTGDPENPTTATVERNFIRLPARHNGQTFDHTHKTPSGRPHVRRTKVGETADIPGNCPETQTFRKIEERGGIIRGGKGSAVCESCPLFGAGCEFIPERRLTLERETLIATHGDQLPEQVRKDWNVLAIHDEPGQNVKATKTIRFGWESFRRGLERIRSLDAGIYGYLFPVFMGWYTAIPANINQRFGLNFIELVESLSAPRFIAGKGQTMTFLEVCEQADKLLNPQISLSGIQTPTEKQSWVEDNIHPHYFSLLFKALTDADRRSSVTLDHNWNFTVTRRNYHYQRVAESMAGNIWLDATLTTGDLALKVGAKTDDFLPYEMVAEDASAKPYENLTLKVINRVGRCGQNREAGSPFAQADRLAKLDEAIAQQIAQQKPAAIVAGIDFKSHAGEGQGYWFKDSRGSNAYQDADHLKLYGLPIQNLGAMAAEYQALTGYAVRPEDLTGSKGDWFYSSEIVTPKPKTGHSKNYGHWVRRRTMAEVVQGIGRLRANRTDKAKTCWLIGDGYDASVVAKLQQAFPGCTVELMAATDICTEAAPKGEQRVMGMIDATWELVKADAKVTTSAVAKAVDVNRTRISQIARDFGGFEHLTGVLISLYKALQGKLTASELSEEAWFVAQTWLPDIAAQIEAGEEIDVIAELAAIREGFGTRTYLAILAATPPRALGKLLKWALCHLPPAILRDIGEAEPILA